MNLNLSGKKAMVCGSTQGIGKASALELASLGASVILVARNEEELKKVKSELPERTIITMKQKSFSSSLKEMFQ